MEFQDQGYKFGKILQKSGFLKLIISFFQFFGAKIEITKWVEKTPICIFRIKNKQVWAEKIRKKEKKFQVQKMQKTS